MIPRELTEGVQKMLSAGAPREVVWEFLLERGWSEDDAKEVFASLQKQDQGKEKEIQKVLLREATPPRQPSQEKEEKRAFTEEPKKVNLSVVKAVSPSPEKRPQENLPLVVVKKEEKIERPAVQPVKEKTEQKRKAPDTHTRFKDREEDRKSPKEPTSRLSRRPAQKEKPPFLSEEGEEEAELFEMERLSSPFRLMSVALSLVRQRFWNLFFLSFMVSVLYLLFYIVLSYVFTGENVARAWSSLVQSEAGVLMTTALLVVFALVAGFIGLGLFFWLPAAYVLAFSGRASTFRDLFIQGFKSGFSFFVATIFFLLFILSGSVPLIIPGVILSVWFIFAPIITVAERTSPFVALLVSRELVRHHFWDVVLREAFLLIPVLLAAIVLLLLLTPLSLLDSLGDTLGLGIGLIVFVFVSFAAVLFFFAFMLFFFAYHVALYKEMRARAQSIRLSSRLSGTLPFLLIIPLLLSLAVALYVSSRF
ncbi:MAG: hypothetical protein WDZ74_01560 [Candidatus Paceibacterota bacterium]